MRLHCTYGQNTPNSRTAKAAHPRAGTAGLSQRELARRAGTVSQVVNQLESGAAHASAELLQRIGDELGLDITVGISIKRKRKN